MLFWHSMSIAQQLIHIYNTSVHKNKNIIKLPLLWLTVGTVRHKHATMTDIFQNHMLTELPYFSSNYFTFTSDHFSCFLQNNLTMTLI